ncbi:MAG: Eco57I restriction-modification methylase domain-containing protein [Candidatus Desantisbacteria bacterium]
MPEYRTNGREKLDDIIKNFSPEKFSRFFREKNRSFAPRQESFSHYDDGSFGNGLKLGDIEFSETELIVCSFKVKQSLTERSGKKAQYEKGKKILRETQSDAGIFIFYDPQGNFRFSLIYLETIGNRRQGNNFRRFTYFVSREFTNRTYLTRIGDGDLSSLEKIKDAFSVEKVTKEFYENISKWYLWAVREVSFPKDAEEEKGKNIAVIRMITRLIFIWFMRERGLVPKELFEENNIREMLEDVSSESSTYYQAILQNLFFATLSTKQEERQFRSEIRGYKGYNPDFDNQNVFRFQDLFKNPNKLKDYFGEIPFLNGGLFECLDDKPNGIYIDGFTSVKKNQPNVPNFLFFGKEQAVDLNTDYGTNNKTYKVSGLLNILSSFNFTIDENSPDDQDVALDPELLGRVFENLLASFNPETSTTARKATGSYYTPREIVNYMVIESLKAYFRTHLEGIEKIDEKLGNLFSTESENNPFDEQESKKLVELIENVKIVDPAVGSGAFPMGVLNKLVFVLNKVDPGNELWKQAQIKAADAIPDPCVRRDTKSRIEEFFKGKNKDYGRKLYLIQRCIYGVDIQQIAVEIAKLRFFISLLVDEAIDKTKDNWGIEPLPNLDFKIMQGNSLIEEYEGVKLFDEKLITSNDFDKQKLIESIKQEQLELHKEYLDLHAKNKLTKIKQAELNEALKKLGNQLRGLEKQDNKFEGIFELFGNQNEAKQKREMLKRLHREFFETNEKEAKGKIKKQIEKMEWDLIEATLREQDKISELKEIEKFKKSNKKPFFLWKLHFAEVFENGGFDVVIGNPPYVRQEEIKEYKPLFQKAGYQVYNSTSDLYTYFYELSYNILAPSRFSCFISSNKWMRAKYGEKLRNFFKTKTKVMKLIDFGGHKVFETATVDTNILLFQKAKPQPEYTAVYINIENDFTGDNLDEYVHKKQQTIKQNELSDSGWTLADDKVLALKKKIEKIGIPLKDWDVRICFGIKTGFNKAFIIDTATKERLCAEDPKSIEIIKSILRGRDINRYCYNWAGLWLIKIESGWTNSNRKQEDPEKYFKESYPAVYSYLRTMDKSIGKGKGLLNRDDQGDYWWELRDCAYYPEFEKEKIVWQRVTKTSMFCLVKKGVYIQDSMAFMIADEDTKYILALLNSKLLNYYFESIGHQYGNTGFLCSNQYIERIPVPKISESDQTPFIDLVDKILAITKDADYLTNPTKQARVKEYSHQLDQMVYELYGLSDDEIEIVEGIGK